MGEDGGIDGLLSAAAWRTCTARSCAGRTHALGLSAIGRAEITAVANRLAEDKINALYSSPLQRTRETAEILSERLNLPVAYRDDSLKLDFGDGSNGSAINQVGYNTHYLPPTGQKVVDVIPAPQSRAASCYTTASSAAALGYLGAVHERGAGAKTGGRVTGVAGAVG